MSQVGQLADHLRAAGLRATGLRIAVLQAARNAPHADPETITRAVRATLGAASSQAIYDALGALCAAGVLRRIEPAGSPGRYEARVADNHHHVVCRRCGATEDVNCVVGARPCLDPDETHGFALDEAEITFWGVCPRCQPTQRRTR